MKSILVNLLLLTGLAVASTASFAGVDFSTDGYRSYEEDIDGDGLADLVFIPKEKFILIAGPVDIPIITTTSDSFVLLNEGGGNFVLTDAIPTSFDESSASELSNYTATVSSDYTGDGKADLLIQPVGTSHDIILVWSTTTTNAPQSIEQYSSLSELTGKHTFDGTLITYHHTDALGSATLSTNEIGEVQAYNRFKPYGAQVASTGFQYQGDTKGFTGHTYEQGVSLTYMGARFYDQDIGRFYVNDPVPYIEGTTFSLNRYAYANNSPQGYVDPDGREPVKSQAITWSEARSIIEGHSDITLSGLRYTSGAAGGGGQVGPFGGGTGGRYIYTKSRGWVDLAHFFQAASAGKNSIDSMDFTNRGVLFGAVQKSGTLQTIAVWKLWQATKAQEDGQSGYATSWSYEDGPSNASGLDFLLNYYTDSESLLSDLDRYFYDKGASNPESAPNWQHLPEKEHLTERAYPPHKSLKPIELE